MTMDGKLNPVRWKDFFENKMIEGKIYGKHDPEEVQFFIDHHETLYWEIYINWKIWVNDYVFERLDKPIIESTTVGT